MTKSARRYLLKLLDSPLYGITNKVPIAAVQSVKARLGKPEQPAIGAFTPPLPPGYWREKSQYTREKLALHHRLHVARHHSLAHT